MSDPLASPLLFLDVDGTLIPFGVPPGPRPEVPSVQDTPRLRDTLSNPLLARLNPLHGRYLLALPCQLVWASTWMSDANDEVAPRLGLPELPVVAWPASDDNQEVHGLHWKTPTLVAWAAGRPFVWVDDEITDTDRSWVADHHDGRAHLHRVNPSLGLTDTDFAIITDWLEQCYPT